MVKIVKTLSFVAMLALSACSSQYVMHDVSGFPYRHSDFDYKVAWKTTQTNNAVVIDGVLKNIRYAAVDSVDVTVYLVGADGKVHGRTTTIPIPQHSRIDEIVPFTAELRNVALNQGDTFKFVIHYISSDGGPEDGNDWRSTFIADAMTGKIWHEETE